MDCVVPSCNSRRDVQRHNFPRNSALGQEWLKAVNNPILKQYTYEEILKKQLRVCYKHFPPNSWIPTLKKPRLKDNAVPSLLLDEPATDEYFAGRSIDAAVTQNQENCVPNLVLNDFFPVATYEISPCITSIRKSSLGEPIESQRERNRPAELSKIGANIFSTPQVPVVHSQLSISAEKVENLQNKTNRQSSSAPERRKKRSAKMKDLSLTVKGQKVFNETLQLRKELTSKSRRLQRSKEAQMNMKKKCMLYFKNFDRLSSTQQTIILMQLSNDYKDPNGRKFTEAEKNIGLALFKHSPATYGYMCTLLKLPSITTVNRSLANVEFDTGTNLNISQLLKECTEQMSDERDKVQIVMWDETDLKTELHYDYKKDKIIGFEDFGDQRTSSFADHMLVFMARGIHKNTKLPISYYFSHGQTKAEKLQGIIKQNVQHLDECGFDVVAGVCDQGSSNLRAMELLREEYEVKCIQNQMEPDPHVGVIEIGNSKLTLLYDSSHLVKSTRSNLETKHLQIDCKKAAEDKSLPRKYVKWHHFVTAYKMDVNSNNSFRNIPKITLNHVKVGRIKKRRVSYSTQIFSTSMARFISNLVNCKGHLKTSKGTISLPKEAIYTSQYAQFMDELFDSCNARLKKRCALKIHKPLQQVVTDESPHLEFWIEAAGKFKNMRYVKQNCKSPLRNPPSLNGWIYNLKTMPVLWKFLKEKGFLFMKTGYINQDPLGNFFVSLKRRGARHVSPSCYQTEGLYKALLVPRLSNFSSKNTNEERSGNRSHQIHAQESKNEEKWSPLGIATHMDSASEFARLLLHKIDSIRQCQDCHNTFFSDLKKGNSQFLEATNLTANQPGAADDYFETFTKSVSIIDKCLPRIAWAVHLRETLQKYLTSRNLHFEWVKCNEHRQIICQQFNECIAVHCILKWCIHINHLLSGRTAVVRNEIEKRARQHYMKGLNTTAGIDVKKNPFDRD